MTTLPPEGEGEATPQQPAEGAQAPTPPQAEDSAHAGVPQPPTAPDASGNVPPPAYAPPPAQPAYGTPQPPQGGAPQQGYPAQAPAADPVSNLTLNYWLSVFFLWIPALIFYIIEKDKGNAHIRALHAANLNFALIRTALLVVGWVLAIIPVLGPILVFLAHVVLFIFHIIAATKVTDTYRRGGGDPFIFNIPLVK
ncbi:MAG: DUF4870 domain-containing protein [Leucobacter sp.]